MSFAHLGEPSGVLGRSPSPGTPVRAVGWAHPEPSWPWVWGGLPLAHLQSHRTPQCPPTPAPGTSRVPRALGSPLRGWHRFTSLLLLPLSKSSTDLPQTREETWHSPLSRSERLCNRAHRLCKCLLAGLFGSAGPELGRSTPTHTPPVLDCLLPLPSPP